MTVVILLLLCRITTLFKFSLEFTTYLLLTNYHEERMKCLS